MATHRKRLVKPSGLDRVKSGTVLRVETASDDFPMDEHYIKTDNQEFPLLTIRNGELKTLQPDSQVVFELMKVDGITIATKI